MAGVRAQQKEKTRRAIIDAALNQLSAEQSFASMSLREVAREAKIAPTSFYRHFRDMEELGLTLVDECGVTLRQLMRQARKRFEPKTSIIQVSVETFMEFVEQNANIFRLLLRERTGTSKAFREAVAREIEHFTSELTDYLLQGDHAETKLARIQAEALVTVVFNNGAEILDANRKMRKQITEDTIIQLRFIAHGAAAYQKQKKAPNSESDRKA